MNARLNALATDDATKARPWHALQNLREKRFADVHETSPRGQPLGKYPKMKNLNSNRHQIKSASRPRRYWLLLINNTA
jgi:hypothetical protein